MVLTLYKKDSSPPCRAVFMVLEALRIKDVSYVNINLQLRENHKEDYLKINPQHTVPTLVDGDFIIWDSHAITTYLVNKYAENDSLYPKDPQMRALVDLRLHFDSGILFPSLRETMIPLLYQGEKKIRPEYLAKIRSGYALIEKIFIGPWLAGDNITLADICCVSTISSLNEIVPIDANLYPNLTDWLSCCSTQEFYVKGNMPGMKTFRELLQSILACK